MTTSLIEYQSTETYEPEQLITSFGYLIYLYSILILIVLGCSGNIVAITVFYKSKLREQSTSVYLSALALSDTVFLLQVLYTWLIGQQIILASNVMCQLVQYLAYVSCEFSAWCIAAFTVERYIAIVYPLHLKWICTVRRAQCIVVALAVIVFLINVPVLIFTDCPEGNYKIKDDYWQQADNFNIFDTVVSFTIPLASIVFLNVWIILEVNRSRRTHKRLRQTQASNRVTVMLLVVSSVYVLLNLPAYVLRIYAYAQTVVIEEIEEWLHLTQLISVYLFYANFGINFYVYCISGTKFRDALVETFPRMCCFWRKPDRLHHSCSCMV